MWETVSQTLLQYQSRLWAVTLAVRSFLESLRLSDKLLVADSIALAAVFAYEQWCVDRF